MMCTHTTTPLFEIEWQREGVWFQAYTEFVHQLYILQ